MANKRLSTYIANTYMCKISDEKGICMERYLTYLEQVKTQVIQQKASKQAKKNKKVNDQTLVSTMRRQSNFSAPSWFPGSAARARNWDHQALQRRSTYPAMSILICVKV